MASLVEAGFEPLVTVGDMVDAAAERDERADSITPGSFVCVSVSVLVKTMPRKSRHKSQSTSPTSAVRHDFSNLGRDGNGGLCVGAQRGNTVLQAILKGLDTTETGVETAGAVESVGLGDKVIITDLLEWWVSASCRYFFFLLLREFRSSSSSICQ